MPLSSFEVAMQTMASVLSDYLEGENNAPGITDDGLNKLMKEQFLHCEMEKISSGVYYIAILLECRPFKISEEELRTASENSLSPHKISLGSSMLPEGSIHQMVKEEVTNLQEEDVYSLRMQFMTRTAKLLADLDAFVEEVGVLLTSKYR